MKKRYNVLTERMQYIENYFFTAFKERIAMFKMHFRFSAFSIVCISILDLL